MTLNTGILCRTRRTRKRGIGMNFKAKINGLDIDAVFRDEDIENIYIPLLKRLSEMRKKKNGRVIVMLAAPPGVGKSTLSCFLQYLSENTEGVDPLTAIGMDGFHHYQKYLDAHETVRDGVTIPMAKIKGAPITFDLEKLTAKVKELAEGNPCMWPDYSRVIEDSVEDVHNVTGDIVLLEGNYLLLDEPGWRDLKNYADYTIRITAKEEDVRDRLIDRKSRSGKVTHEEAVRHVDYSDMYNFRLVSNYSMPADLMLEITGI